MNEALEVGQELKLNPYVVQMEKLSDSLQYLSKVFKQKGVSSGKHLEQGDVEEIYNCIDHKLCRECEYASGCETNEKVQLQFIIESLYTDIEEYGVELSIKKRRELERKCEKFSDLKEEVQRCFWILKNNKLWEARIVQSQDASLVAMRAFVDAVEETTKEIDASVFHDDRIEQKISKRLQRVGVRTLKVVLFVSDKGRYEVHISAKIKGGNYITNNHIANVISEVLGKHMIPEKKERLVLKEIYTTIVFVERPRFQMLYAVAKQAKDKSEVSGDNFLVADLPGGKTCAIVSDGMGSGTSAYKKSKILLELAEKLLEAGISAKLAIQMMNAALITEIQEVEFATLDMCLIDVYRGTYEMIKAGAAGTYIVTSKEVICCEASSLPIGVISNIEMNYFKGEINEECYIVMVTDGINEVIQDIGGGEYIRVMMRQAKTKNPKEIATYILEDVLELQKGIAKDDMMVLVLGVWELQF